MRQSATYTIKYLLNLDSRIYGRPEILLAGRIRLWFVIQTSMSSFWGHDKPFWIVSNPSLKNRHNDIKSVVRTNQYPKATIYFTHSGTLLKMLAHLGLYKDADTLTASKYREMTNRKWKTSLIDSFATNLAFVLYEWVIIMNKPALPVWFFSCDGTEKVLTLHQENIVKLPSCPDSDLCDLRNINNYYSQSIDSCDFNVMCNVSENSDH